MSDRNRVPERIICAANKYEDLVILGMRHNDEFMQRAVVSLPFELKKKIFNGSSQGFWTNRRRWVTREEARIIAEEQGQLLARCSSGSKLYSEDLY